jgi:hypothetical protein
MSKISDPIEKKRLSLTLDRRNVYGENARSSRKNIPAAKARGHRKERRVVGELLSHGHVAGPDDDAVAIEGQIKTRTRAKKLVGFKKVPDQPLADVVAHKLQSRRKASAGNS